MCGSVDVAGNFSSVDGCIDGTDGPADNSCTVCGGDDIAGGGGDGSDGAGGTSGSGGGDDGSSGATADSGSDGGSDRVGCNNGSDRGGVDGRDSPTDSNGAVGFVDGIVIDGSVDSAGQSGFGGGDVDSTVDDSISKITATTTTTSNGIVAGGVVSNNAFDCLMLFSTIATVLQLYHGHDMMHEMRRTKPKPTLFLTQGIFNLPYHICTI